ncbi:MAG: carbon-nitrogen family hydrolase, partial [Eubacteriaceae bacterium]|nr:carbon-nitrogen family hydrolase [Eubacteriaceae bacterium]
MRVALGQLDMVWEDKEASFLKAEHMMEQAKDAGCDVIVFPEMSFTGYSMNVKEIAEDCEHSMTKERMKRDA